MVPVRLLAATAVAFLFCASPAWASESSLPGYRSNFTLATNGDGSVTATSLINNSTQSIEAGTQTITFMDAVVSYDGSGYPGQAFRLYQAAFDRPSDAGGLGFWISALQGGMSLETVAGYFYSSPEFQSKYGSLSDTQFATQLYLNVLHRNPDADGLAFWLKAMAGGLSRPAVLKYFGESPENQANLAPVIKNGIDYLPAGGSTYSPALQTANPPAPTIYPTTSLNLTTNIADVTGTYQRLPVENGYHTGQVALQSGSTSMLYWKNEAGASWTLTPDLANGVLKTDNSNPYRNSTNGVDFRLVYVNNKVAGFYFVGEFYARNGIPLPTGVTPTLAKLTQSTSGPGGYLAHRMDSAPAGYGFGFSLYAAMWPMVDAPTESWQAGIGTWVIPNNRDYTQALLPPDNSMRQSTPNAAPNWDNVFQTIEGGAGSWASTQHPVKEAKFSIMGTTDGYGHMMNSPGWGYQYLDGMAHQWMAIAQMSNRVLTPPDGYTFKQGTAGEFLGYGWMALPLTDATTSVGNQSWTLFFNASNFAGPVAFWIPDAWTVLSRTWSPAAGRGLDTLDARADSTAIEFGNMPMYSNGDANGNQYLRIPRILFPVDGDTTYLAVDWNKYNASALFDPVRNWFAGGSSVSGTFDRSNAQAVVMSEPSFGLSYKGTEITGLDHYVSPVVTTTPGGGNAFGLKWTGNGQPGVLPEYFKKTGTTLVPVDGYDVPKETLLTQMSFSAPSNRNKPYTSPTTGADSWATPAPAAGPFQATLTDGSKVTYYWYKFINQPSLQGFAFSDSDKAKLQARIEKIHRNWAGTREFIAPPSSGVLATLDAALLVTPPAGLEIGYVPVVTRQE